ncbi:hypothetical protein B0D95_10175 [Cellvibrio sp. PSBB023]|nr:hypothetical protein B0D95_10175 [Cellvibrio sp. PSBB023]
MMTLFQVALLHPLAHPFADMIQIGLTTWHQAGCQLAIIELQRALILHNREYVMGGNYIDGEDLLHNPPALECSFTFFTMLKSTTQIKTNPL